MACASLLKISIYACRVTSSLSSFFLRVRFYKSPKDAQLKALFPAMLQTLTQALTPSYTAMVQGAVKEERVDGSACGCRTQHICLSDYRDGRGRGWVPRLLLLSEATSWVQKHILVKDILYHHPGIWKSSITITTI